MSGLCFIIFHLKGSQDRNLNTAGKAGADVEVRGALLTGLFSRLTQPAFLSWLLSEPPAQEWPRPSHVNYQSRRCSTGLPEAQSSQGIFSIVVPSSQMTLACVESPAHTLSVARRWETPLPASELFTRLPPARCCSPASLPSPSGITTHPCRHHQNRSFMGDGDFSCLMSHVTGTVQARVHAPLAPSSDLRGAHQRWESLSLSHTDF